MNKKTTSHTQFHGVGRRKRAVARVWMKPGKGKEIDKMMKKFGGKFHAGAMFK